MKKSTAYLLLFFVIFSSCSREEWLDIKPKGVIIPSRVNDYRLIMDQVDLFGQGADKISPGFGVSYTNTDYMSDDFVIRDEIMNRFGQTTINKFTWQDNIYDENAEDADWALLYGQIYAANVVIEEVMEASGGTMAQKLQILAEAKIQRAFSYYALVNMYGLHYTSSNAFEMPGVPHRLDSSLGDIDLSRVSVGEIYEFMLEEVESSIDDLPEIPEANNQKHRPTKVGAYAFLARLYLYMGNYEECLQATNQSLALYNTVNDYNTHTIQYNVLLLPYPQDDNQLLWYKESNATFALLVASDDLYNLYEEGDLRRQLYSPISFLFGIPEDGFALAYQYFINYRNVGCTVPEVLLMRAESSARLGDTAQAVQDLNTLRINRFNSESYEAITSTDPGEILALVKDERRRELSGSGLRFFDLKRYNAFDNANITLSRNLDGQTFTLPANSNNWAIPIAQKYILQSPQIGENIRD